MFFQEKKIVAKKIKNEKKKRKKERKETVQWVTNPSFCDYRVSRALKKQELLSTAPRASSNFYASLVLSKLPTCTHNSIYER